MRETKRGLDLENLINMIKDTNISKGRVLFFELFGFGGYNWALLDKKEMLKMGKDLLEKLKLVLQEKR